MIIDTEHKPTSVVFYFQGMGPLKTAEITDENVLLINGYERTDWRAPNTEKNKPENMVAQKYHLNHPFFTGKPIDPILTASKSIDGRVFLRIYQNETALQAFRHEAEWVGSYWKGEVYEKRREQQIAKTL